MRRFTKIHPEIPDQDNRIVCIGRSCQPALGDKISILVWNIFKARKAGWHQDFRTLKQDRDLILLQESVLNTHDDTIFEHSQRFEWVMAWSYKYGGDTPISTGLKTGAVVPAQASNFFRSPDREPFFNTAKLALTTRYLLEKSQRTLLVVNVHAINFVTLEKYKRHIQQILPLVQEHNGPVILAGDLNCWSKARADFLFGCMKEAGLTLAIPSSRARWQHFNRQLDHIFYRDLTLNSVDIFTHIKSSDHFPIAAEFSE